MADDSGTSERSEQADRNLLFGLIAMQSDLIEMRHFVDACTLWGTRKDSSLAEILVEQGWLPAEDRQHVEYLLRRRIQKAHGDAKATLAGMPNDVKAALSSIDDRAVRESLSAIGLNDRITTSSLISPTTTSVDRLTRRSLHSSGGIGHVWRAYDNVLGREIALKELKVDQARSELNRQRFFREAQITAQLTHPGTVPVYDYGEDNGRSYYTMKLVSSRTLAQAIADYHQWRRAHEQAAVSGRLVQLLNQFVSICNTVAFAHSRRILHRDLKSENVIVGDFGEVLVLDWGLAKRLDDADEIQQASDSNALDKTLNFQSTATQCAHTMQGDKLGTPAYMSPEQARGEIAMLDERTDVYGLAAILYEILVGQPPFLGKSIIELLDRVIHDAPTPPTELVDNVPRELEQICLRGLSKKRDHRQQSATELAEQIHAWIAERAERKRTEQERERFFNLSLDLLAIVDPMGRFTLTNPAWQSVLGWSAEQLNTKRVWELIAPEDHPRAIKNHERILAGEPMTELEYRCCCQDGSYRWILWNAQLIPRESSIYLVGRDISERKRLAQTFQELLESAPDAMVVVNASGSIVLVNAQLECLFGYARQELLEGPIEQLVPSQFRDTHAAKVSAFISSPSARPMSAALKLLGERKDGSVFPVEISLSPVHTEQGLLVSCAVRDITKRQKDHDTMQALLESAPDAMVVVGVDRHIRLVNRQTERLFGFRRSELLGQPIEILIPERFRASHPAKFAEFVRNPAALPFSSRMSLWGRNKDGHEFPVDISLSPVDTEDGLLISSAIRPTMPATAR